MERNNAILVCGMHRCGTSAIAGALDILDWDLGKELVPADLESNPLGHFENNAIVKFNKKIFKLSGTSWNDSQVSYLKINEAIDREIIVDTLQKIINSEFGSSKDIVIKDPRISLLLPYYIEALESIGYAVSIIVCKRHPNEVAKSLHKRNQVSLERSNLIYSLYLSHAEYFSRGHSRVFVDYASFVANPSKTIDTICSQLELKKPSKKDQSALTSFVSADYYHFKVNGSTEGENEISFKLYSELKDLELIDTSTIATNIIELDNLYKQGDKKFLDTEEVNKLYYTQLFIDEGNGFNEIKSIKKNILGFETQIIFELHKHTNLKGLRFDPVNTSCLVRLYNLRLILEDKSEVELDFNGNYSWADQHLYLFDNKDPKIFITLPEVEKHIHSFVLSVNYFSIGYESIKYFSNIQKQINTLRNVNDKVLEEKKLTDERLANYTSSLQTLENKYQGEINSLTSALNEAKSSIQSQSEVNIKLQSRDSEIHQKNIFIENQASKIKALDTSLDDLQKRLKQIDSLNATLQKQVERNFDFEKQVQDQIKEKQDQINSLDTEISKFKNKINLLVEEIEGKEREILEHKETTSRIRGSKIELENSLLAERNKFNQTTHTINALKKEIHDKQVHISNIEMFLKQRDSQLEGNKSLITTFKSELKKHIEEKRELHQKVGQLSELTKGLINSASFKLGFGATAPIRKLYDTINKSEGVDTIQRLEALINQPSQYSFELPYSEEEVTFENEKIGSLKRRIDQDSKLDAPKIYRQSVLYISPHLPDYDTSSGGKRATRMIELLSENYKVYVFTLGDKPERHVEKLESLGATVLSSPHFEDLDIPNYDHQDLFEQLPAVDAIIFAWYISHKWSAKISDYYKDANIILDSVDVHWVREERLIGVDENHTKDRARIIKEEEVASYQAASLIWAVTETDVEVIEEEIPSSNCLVVSNIHENHISTYRDNNANTVLFFGGYAHIPNLSAAKLLANEILPKIRISIPDARLILAGSSAPQEIKELGDLEWVDFRGFIEEEDIDSLYEESFLTIVPLLAGAGIKGKICEAIAYRTPIITNDIGNEGIELVHEVDGLVSNDVDQLAELAIKAFRREYDFPAMTQRAQVKLDKIVGPSGVKKNMVISITPPITICVVTWNRLELVKRCIESVLNNTLYPDYKLVVYSNGCEDGTQEYLKSISNSDSRIIPVLSKTNDVFVLPNNHMMQMHMEDDVVLLNNDTYVTRGWLTNLHKAAYSGPTVGIAGSKIIYPNGKLQEFGSELYSNETGNNIGKNDNPNKQDYSGIRKVGYVSGCSMYIRRTTLERIGYFDEQFHPCYCEDSDMCYTAAEHGIDSVVTGNSVIYHDEGGTSGTSTSGGFKQYQTINFKKFVEKHKWKDNGIEWFNRVDLLRELTNGANNRYQSKSCLNLIEGTQTNLSTQTGEIIYTPVSNLTEYLKVNYENKAVFKKRNLIEFTLFNGHNENFDLTAFSPITNKVEKFEVQNDGKAKPNYRETITNRFNQLNSRMRATFLFTQLSSETLDKDASILITEYNTPLYFGFLESFKNVEGASHIPEHKRKDKSLINIHQDFTSMKFEDESFDIVVCSEILQHIPDFQSAIKEIYRILKPGGKVIFSIPFNVHSSNNKRLKESNLKWDEWSQVFGWDIIANVNACGFSNTESRFIWSLYYGILGNDIGIVYADK